MLRRARATEMPVSVSPAPRPSTRRLSVVGEKRRDASVMQRSASPVESSSGAASV